MSQNGKGDSRRPAMITAEKYGEKFDRIFRKSESDGDETRAFRKWLGTIEGRKCLMPPFSNTDTQLQSRKLHAAFLSGRKDIDNLRAENIELLEALKECRQALLDYEVSVDMAEGEGKPIKHRDMMARALAAIENAGGAK